MTENAATPYRVLARKYRPTDFSGLIGQEALVRTLSNAIESGRLAHAFVLTGVRGVGKTTTARIIARALNCTGPDGQGGPTVNPCGVCENCRAIAEDRHVDVLEMDAASRTGIDDIREVIAGVRYRPTSARFKVYIIDEVHMLSEKAFNALLKTLEEPPEHVKFVFATTEVRKIPITVLSRCQRFDLRRVEIADLSRHFAAIAEKEGVSVEEQAMAMICRAADGSVRDGLSLLDQAIAHCAGAVTAEAVQDMLGLADRARVFDLFDLVMKGDIAAALGEMGSQYAAGADPLAILTDLLELTHRVTRMKLAPDPDMILTEIERVRGQDMAKTLSVPVLTRTWQILLKGMGEVQSSQRPLQAAEMVLVRLAFAADLPTPAEALEALRKGSGGAWPSSGGGGRPIGGAPAGGSSMVQAQAVYAGQPVAHAGTGTAVRALAPAPAPRPDAPASFPQLIEFLHEKRESRVAAELKNAVHLVSYEIGHIEFRPAETASPELAQNLSRLLKEMTGQPWLVSLSRQDGDKTVRQQELEHELERRRDAAEHPVVKAVLAAFPGTTIEAVRDLAGDLPAPPMADGDLQNGDDE